MALMAKRGRGSGFVPPRGDRLIREHEHDPYKVRSKLPDPSACTDCGVMYRAGRWTWGAAPADAKPVVCPACQRVRDDYPAGFLRVHGEFVGPHHHELVGLARNVEEREKGQHPLKRIMAVSETEGGFVVTTTDAGLARNIGDALQRAYEGELDYQYTEEGSILRVTWSR